MLLHHVVLHHGCLSLVAGVVHLSFPFNELKRVKRLSFSPFILLTFSLFLFLFECKRMRLTLSLFILFLLLSGKKEQIFNSFFLSHPFAQFPVADR